MLLDINDNHVGMVGPFFIAIKWVVVEDGEVRQVTTGPSKVEMYKVR